MVRSKVNSASKPNLSIEINDFHAIRHAKIDIGGITVVTGVNASGKSTISRLLYYTLYYSNRYEELIRPDYNLEIGSLTLITSAIFESLFRRCAQSNNETQVRGMIQDLSLSDFSKFDLAKYESDFKYIVGYFDNCKPSPLDRSRLSKYLRRPIDTSEVFWSEFSNMPKRASQIMERFQSDLNDRSRDPFEYLIHAEFGFLDDPEKLDFQVKEVYAEGNNDNFIVSHDLNDLGIATSIDQVYYVDTPMVLNSGELRFAPRHWDNLLDSLYLMPQIDSEPMQLISPIRRSFVSIIGGFPSLKKEAMRFRSSSKFQFTDSQSGETFSLKEAATGVKSFSILYLLLERGLLNEHTLLIIDEPEVHLHPQWIVEYAKLVAILNRVLGVKFLIASHSPDFVETLEILSDEKMTSEPVKFYLGQRLEGDSKATFKRCSDIEPIFKEFNVAIDKKYRLYGNGEN